MNVEKLLHNIVYFILNHSKVNGFLVTERMFSVNTIDSSQRLNDAYEAVQSVMEDSGMKIEFIK